jgi:hypothetical protein
MKTITLVLLALTLPTTAYALSNGHCNCKSHCRRGSNLYASLKGGVQKCLARCERDYNGCKVGDVRGGRRPPEVK